MFLKLNIHLQIFNIRSEDCRYSNRVVTRVHFKINLQIEN